MFIEDLSRKNKKLFIKELKKHYPKRIVDIEKLFIRVKRIDEHSIQRLERLRQLESNQKAFLFIGYSKAELFIL